MSRLRPTHALKDLDKEINRISGIYGPLARNRPIDDPERLAAQHELATAKIAYRIAQAIDDSPSPVTEEDAAYFCAIIHGRVNEDD